MWRWVWRVAAAGGKRSGEETSRCKIDTHSTLISTKQDGKRGRNAEGATRRRKTKHFLKKKKENCNRKRPLRFVDFAGATGGTRRLLFFPFPLVPLVPFLPSFFPWLSPSFSLSLFLSLSLFPLVWVYLFHFMWPSLSQSNQCLHFSAGPSLYSTSFHFQFI